MSKQTSRRQRRSQQGQRNKPRGHSPALTRMRARDALPTDYSHITKDLKRIAFLGSGIIICLIALSFLIN
jgi:hypothetical protein